MAEVKDWNSEEFAAAIAKGVTLVDFYAVWCGPCKMMMSVLENVAAGFGDQVKFGKINIDQCRELAAQYKVRTIPTFIVFKDGEVHSVNIGVLGQKQLTNAVKEALE